MTIFEYGLVDLVKSDARAESFFLGRGYPGPAPQDAPGPYWTYRLISTDKGRYLRGRNQATRLMYQLDVWDTDHDRCAEAADVLDDVLDGFRGWALGCFVRRMQCKVAAADDEPDDDVSDGKWFRRRLEITADIDANRTDYPDRFQG